MWPTKVRLLLACCVHGRGHAADDLPRAARSSPHVRDPQSVGPNLRACSVRPRCSDSIIVGRDVTSNLNRELLDRVGLKGDAFGRVRGDPVGDVILSHRRWTHVWPADKILMPQRAIFLEVIGFHVFPVRFFQLPHLRFVPC